jgi:hypothetical protein
LRVLFGFETAPEFVVIDDFSNVLYDEIAFLYVSMRFKPPAFSSSIERVERRRKTLLETLVLAQFPTSANIRVTFKQQYSKIT